MTKLHFYSLMTGSQAIAHFKANTSSHMKINFLRRFCDALRKLQSKN